MTGSRARIAGITPQLRTTDLEASIRFCVDRPWNTREVVPSDDQGHTLSFSQPLTPKEQAA